jgi:hypothetical protein
MERSSEFRKRAACENKVQRNFIKKWGGRIQAHLGAIKHGIIARAVYYTDWARAKQHHINRPYSKP